MEAITATQEAQLESFIGMMVPRNIMSKMRKLIESAYNQIFQIRIEFECKSDLAPFISKLDATIAQINALIAA